MQAIRYEATVGSDHALHVATPDLPEGTVTEVMVLVRHRPFKVNKDFATMLGQFPHYRDLEEVNDYVNPLRRDR
ncbi:MAG: hypothetical protein V5B39_06155 [Accumulibacter sp.]|jgi:hypothetical protein|uniref:hypothetical protein n=1 Tax=Accumulibacter sp. TaxID=2053492 RepID=UPI002FC3D2F7